MQIDEGMCGPYKVHTKKKMNENTDLKKNHVSSSNNDTSSSDSSTCDNANSDSFDGELDVKMPAIATKRNSLTVKQSDTVQIDVPEDSDESGSASLL